MLKVKPQCDSIKRLDLQELIRLWALVPYKRAGGNEQGPLSVIWFLLGEPGFKAASWKQRPSPH
jgi:hypothetical protein